MHSEYADKLLATTRPAVANAANDPQAVLHAAYDAVVRGDFDRFGESVSEDVELNICGFGPMNGTWRAEAKSSRQPGRTSRNWSISGPDSWPVSLCGRSPLLSRHGA